jgi:hypothetical protein
MWELNLRWCSPTEWHVRMLGEKGRGIWVTRDIEKWTLVEEVDKGFWGFMWPGDPSTPAECLAMAERVWAEQFGEGAT